MIFILKKTYFPDSHNNTYYEIKEIYENIFCIHKFCIEHGEILYHFWIKGIWKSICDRAIIFNYLNTITNKSNFFPTIFFDLNIWSNNKSDYLLYFLRYEIMNLFKDFEEYDNF